MSQERLLALAREASSDYNALVRIGALTEAELERRGLDADEILAVRNGFIERVLALGVPLDGSEGPRRPCC